MTKSIYVAATSQHVGKTTSTLGLVATLRRKGIDVGYCKPVGQEFVDLGDLMVDKDALLFSKIMSFELSSVVHSPVILGQGATTAYLDDPGKFNYRNRILAAARILNSRHDMVVYEGTGHPGVGSVVDLSNAEVAKLLGAEVVMIVEGGIGNTIDRLNMSLALFREKEVPIIGVIINKVRPDKMEKVRSYVKKWLKSENLPLLGVLPYDHSLTSPIFETIRQAVRGKEMMNYHRLDNRIEGIMPGSLVEAHDFENEKNLLLVVSQKRVCSAVRQVMEYAKAAGKEESPLAGIIITGDGRHASSIADEFECEDYIKSHEIPVISTHLDTYGSVVKISKIEVKINTRTPWKALRAIELIREHVNLQKIAPEFLESKQ
ncbi:MAG: AAA family ATPase [Saprospiraceae bacterium]|jgi:BioD-like phosphotransacetylase family protein|nr:AAA family ATPase [Saprospiraceae bacterium]